MGARTPADVGTNGRSDVSLGQEGQPGKDDQFDVVVVGAGIAGLAAAATAASSGVSVLLVDSRRPGGRAVTDQVGRFKFNRGGHALYRTGAGLKVLKRLGVQVAGALPPLKGGQGRLGDQVGRLPTGVPSFFRSPLFDRRSKRKLARVFVGMPLWRQRRCATFIAWWLAVPCRSRSVVDCKAVRVSQARVTSGCSWQATGSGPSVTSQMLPWRAAKRRVARRSSN